MAVNTNYRINLVVDEKMQEILAYFRAKYPLLKDVELIRMAVGGFYSSTIAELPIQKLDDKSSKSLQKSIKNLNQSDPVFDNTDTLVDYLDK
jgi:hypothetical protein